MAIFGGSSKKENKTITTTTSTAADNEAIALEDSRLSENDNSLNITLASGKKSKGAQRLTVNNTKTDYGAIAESVSLAKNALDSNQAITAQLLGNEDEPTDNIIIAGLIMAALLGGLLIYKG